jgi:hypothetical protein
MNIFDFITDDELADLPEDAAQAFMAFVRIAQKRLYEHEREISTDDGNNYHLIEEARLGFMNVSIAAGKKYEIEPFMGMNVPRVGKFDYERYHQFVADLDHYMTQLVLGNVQRARSETVLLLTGSKDKIRNYVYALKGEIEKSQLSESKRADLLAKLAKFEAALDGSRLNLMEVTMFAMAILGLPGAIWSSADIVNKLTTQVVSTVAEAKVVDDENRRLSPIERPKALLPPRNDREADGPSLRGSEYEDEIPF